MHRYLYQLQCPQLLPSEAAETEESARVLDFTPQVPSTIMSAHSWTQDQDTTDLNWTCMEVSDLFGDMNDAVVGYPEYVGHSPWITEGP